MTPPTKPSAGALKAAAIVYQRYRRNEPTYAPVEVPIVAELIDRESGLAELLEAARDAQCDCSPKERDSGHKSECWFPALREAIAKASNPNADVQQVAPQGRWTEKGTV